MVDSQLNAWKSQLTEPSWFNQTRPKCQVHQLTHVVSQMCVILSRHNCPKVMLCPMSVAHSVQHLFYCGVVSPMCAILFNSCLTVMLCPMSVPPCPTAVLNCDVVSHVCAIRPTVVLGRGVTVQCLCPLASSCLAVTLCPMSVPPCPTAVLNCDVVSHVCAIRPTVVLGRGVTVQCLCPLASSCPAVTLCPMSLPILSNSNVLMSCCVSCLYHSVQQLFHSGVVSPVCHSVQQLSYFDVVSHVCSTLSNSCLTVMLSHICAILSNSYPQVMFSPISVPIPSNSCLKMWFYPISVSCCPAAI